jgi:hypothetical protein
MEGGGGERSQIEVMPPILDVNTTAAKDMEYVAHVIHRLYMVKKKYWWCWGMNK